MRPILLHGHTRSLTKIKYNSDGDLLFSASKDKSPSVWYSHNGERLGTFEGHGGTVWDLDVSYDSNRLLTGGADGACILWNVSNGKELFRWTTETQNAVRAVAFAEGDRKALYVTDKTMGQSCEIFIVEISENIAQQTSGHLKRIVVQGDRATVALWGKLNKTILTGHSDGTISLWNAETGKLLKSIKPHTKLVQDIQFSKDREFFITASKDQSSLIIDATTLEVMKQYTADCPINSASISPLFPQIMLGGGQDAMNVTTTSARQGKFEVRFFHLVFEEEIGRVKGHFGPINTLAFHPNGKSFASGGEDGFVRLHFFDEDYFSFKFPEELTFEMNSDE
ncbi:translation initiation factor eIF3 subunit [Polyrhizophydium stewartii]|uniref:Eukaryotic translation initiation factor 3 subunit I n=1 Tax=Polyrhizophydium stewartii TaxID=2732419 RepID=A0ABR4N511_9FUNG|nr:Eukaryotic translation initiation factor 3 subunit I [Polyrhizophydium stewartii]